MKRNGRRSKIVVIAFRYQSNYIYYNNIYKYIIYMYII